MTQLESGFTDDILADPRYDRNLRWYEKAEYRPRTLHLAKEGPDGQTSTAIIDIRGAAVHEFSIDGQPVLISGDVDWWRPLPGKRDTSHTTLPFGPNGLQPQHGSSRYTDYGIDRLTNGMAVLRATDHLLDATHQQAVQLEPDRLPVFDEVYAHGDMELSFGKHLYFAVPEADLAKLAVVDIAEEGHLTFTRRDGSRITDGLAACMSYLQAGEPLICETTSGMLQIELPDGRRLFLVASAVLEGDLMPVQFAFWHRSGTDTFCIEPLCGVAVGEDGALHNNLVKMTEGQLLEFETVVALERQVEEI